MNSAEYARMDAREATGWWFVAKRLFVRTVLDRFGPAKELYPLLDAGCGAGATLHSMERPQSAQHPTRTSPQPTYGLDPASEALHFARQKSSAALVCGSAEQIPFASHQFQTVLLLDVLEHLDNDQAALAEVYRVLAPGGQLMLTVPAFQRLWCDHDVALHHRRRYRLRQVQSLLAQCGFEVVYASYVFATVFPTAALYRFWRQRFPPESPRADIGDVPLWINGILIAILRFEARAIGHFRLPFGTSILALARKS